MSLLRFIRAYRRRTVVTEEASTGLPLLPPTVVGLTVPEARARYRRRTVAMVGLLVVSWLIFVRLNLADIVSDLTLVRSPKYTAVVETDPLRGGLVLHWREADGSDRYGALEPGDHYTLGQRIRVLDETNECGAWTTVDEESGAVPGIVFFFVVLPLGLVTGYLIHRRSWWTDMLASTEGRLARDTVTGVYTFGLRQGLTMEKEGRTVYVPLLHGQLVTVLESLSVLKPCVGLRPKAVAFRVAGTGRVVWPSGPYRRHLVPWGPIALSLLWVFAPSLLALAVHLTAAPVTPC
jgi:hypothetical protein